MIFTGNILLGKGIEAPSVTGTLEEERPIADDILTIFSNPLTSS